MGVVTCQEDDCVLDVFETEEEADADAEGTVIVDVEDGEWGWDNARWEGWRWDFG